MNLRCLYCQTPFTLSRAEMLSALISMDEKHQNHFDAHCPRCRRANSISRQRMELFFPNWRDAAKNLPAMPAEEVPASSALKTEPLAKSVKSATVKTASKKTTSTSAKPSPEKKQRASKPTTAKKTTPSKPAKPASKPKKK